MQTISVCTYLKVKVIFLDLVRRQNSRFTILAHVDSINKKQRICLVLFASGRLVWNVLEADRNGKVHVRGHVAGVLGVEHVEGVAELETNLEYI